VRKVISNKSEVFRVELELRSRFLRHYEIKDPYDFQKLVGILPERHIYFARFNEKKLVARLRVMGLSARRALEILEDVHLLEGDAWSTLNFLRQELQMKNTRRLLDPLDTNDMVLDALRKWAAMWPVAPKKLGVK
jgi:hypothetical protein